MLSVVIQRTDDHAANSGKHALWIAAARVRKIFHLSRIAFSEPGFRLAHFRKSRGRCYAAKIEAQRLGALGDPNCVGDRPHRYASSLRLLTQMRRSGERGLAEAAYGSIL